ncbi:Septin family p-loop GTPase [Mycena indigotica]|uniref:Septin family p-loop GTPase n=1 Tax=Mycena indigotica TaxID=2126181 RepID=A0A8H6VYM1_9AGAR|nr:Septin family p-loop GTPase [Mycena indigotica]KAF7298964.1 Septin family p-loop GTPase [Mycena indigotica]
MFSSFRRKSSRAEEQPRIRTSPSLPTFSASGLQWPENLVDVDAIRQAAPPEPTGQGAAKASLQGPDSTAAIPFHKPFRPSPGNLSNGPISSLYSTGATPVFDTRNDARKSTVAPRYSQRRARVSPTFNLMVVGARRTGKTSLLRLLVETADISPTATPDQRAAMQRFLRGSPKSTTAIETAVIEICESRFDRVLFSVIDTPGLDFIEGRELKLERQVNSIIKYIDAQYADTMSEESKVIRKSKGDQHIHLCIYLIDPSSVMTNAARRAQSSMPTKTRSETTVSMRDPPESANGFAEEDDSDDETEGPLTMAPSDIRVLRRLAARVNVLPVVARADSLTDEKLVAVKQAIRAGLSEAGLDFGVFSPAKIVDTAETPRRKTRFATERNGQVNGNGNGHPETVGSDEDDGEERQSRPVIKLKPRNRGLSRSRSRRDLSVAADDERRPISPDEESLANVRFSAHIVAKPDLETDMPFALIAPESGKHGSQRISGAMSTAPSSPLQQSEDGHAPSMEDVIPPTPGSVVSNRGLAYLEGPPDTLRGVFLRKFRWGTVDVLDPAHCDYAALRTAVLSTHLKVLKNHTKEVLYEKYRTEKLLARRATANITEEERQRLLEELGL